MLRNRLAFPLGFSVGSLLLASVVACSPEEGSVAPDESLEDRAQKVHARTLTLDTHCDIRLSNFTAERNYTMELDSQVTLPKLERGGLDVVWVIVYTGQKELTDAGYASAYEQALKKFDAIHRLCDDIAPDRIELARTSEEVWRIAASGKKVAMIGIENAYPVGTDLGRIAEFHGMGGRYMSLSHNGHSQFCDSNTGEEDDSWLHGGLSDLGRQAIQEMNRVGIMIDISHPSKRSSMETFVLSRAPVIASHSSARSLNDVSRNLDDEELLALRRNGGVVQTVAFRSYVDSDKHRMYREAVERARQDEAVRLGVEILPRESIEALSDDEWLAYEDGVQRLEDAMVSRMIEIRAGTPPVDVADFVDHIDYLVGLIGIEHVGLSSDFDGGGGVDGWNDASETPNVTLELVRRGYSEEEIALLWSGNLLRVLDEVQRVAAEIQAGG